MNVAGGSGKSSSWGVYDGVRQVASGSEMIVVRRGAAGFMVGTGVGSLGGLIGLGGVEFRLPFLISLFRFAALEAVMLKGDKRGVVVATAALKGNYYDLVTFQ